MLPRKQIAAGHQIATVLHRASPKFIRYSPEGELWHAVIRGALQDADYRGSMVDQPNWDATGKKESPGPLAAKARAFLTSSHFGVVCAALGMEPDWVQELISDHAAWRQI